MVRMITVVVFIAKHKDLPVHVITDETEITVIAKDPDLLAMRCAHEFLPLNITDVSEVHRLKNVGEMIRYFAGR
jgi:hypothetical protein